MKTILISLQNNKYLFRLDFTGSAGTAVVTETDALLWTDSRYYLQAENQLDSKYWTLFKACKTFWSSFNYRKKRFILTYSLIFNEAEPESPSIEEWLVSHLQSGQIVSQNAKFESICKL